MRTPHLHCNVNKEREKKPTAKQKESLAIDP